MRQERMPSTVKAATIRHDDERAQLKAWRKKGPIGKLHNVVKHARWSPKRRAFFRLKKQREADREAGKRLLELILNGGIRWQSDHDMIERAIQLRDF